MSDKNQTILLKVFLFLCGIASIGAFVLGIYMNRNKNLGEHVPQSRCFSDIHPPVEFCDTICIDRATTYQATISQCDSTPFSTADGSRIIPNSGQRWAALSRDLIYDEHRQGLYSDTTHWRGDFKFGDTITVYSKKHPQIDGDYIVHDCMSPKYKMSIDFLGTIVPKIGVGRDVKIITCSNKN